MTLETCCFCFFVDVFCGCLLHYCLDVAVYLFLIFVVVVGFIIFSTWLLLLLLMFVVVSGFIVVSVLFLMFAVVCGLHCSFDVVVTLLLMLVLVGGFIIDNPS
jgi:hypothetical protein